MMINELTEMEFMHEYEKAMVLNKTAVHVSLQGLSVQTSINQYFENKEEQSIEAVYTFPLPINAILLDIIVTLDDKVVRGSIQKKVEAMERYEKAIEKGDTSFLLEKLEDGLYTLNMGNLLASQKAKVSIIYSQILNWLGDELRYVLPTVIAPKYGYCPFEHQQQPEYDYRIEYPLEFLMIIKGVLSVSSIVSPSHKIRCQIEQEGEYSVQKISLQKEAFLDRDLVINLENKTGNTSSAIVQKDEEKYALIAKFNPCFNQDTEQHVSNDIKRSGRVVNILIDCSGSMQGDSIKLAKKALLIALDELNEQDYFSITRFGNDTDNLTKGIIPANKTNVVKARRKVRYIQADLGGTEIFKALKRTMSQSNPSEYQQDCFLVTDGEVWDNDDLDRLIHQFKHKQQRVFSIGVGSAVSEKLVRNLASETLGSSEFVSPNENMVNKIHRHFKRIFMPPLTQVNLNCGQNIIWQSTPKSLFVGDSITIFARLIGKPSDSITLSACADNTVTYKESIPIELSDNPQKSLVRQVAHEYLQTLAHEENKAKIAIQYQLMDETTAFIMVEENEVSDVQGFPAFRKIPQMMAAGWSGQGKIDNDDALLSDISYCMDSPVSYSMDSVASESSADMTYLDVPAFLRRQNDDDDDDLDISSKIFGRRKKLNKEQQELSDFISLFSKEYKTKKIVLDQIKLSALIDLGLPDNFAEDLADITKLMGSDENKILLYFISILSKAYLGITSRFKSKIAILSKSNKLQPDVKELVDDILN